MSQKYDIEKLWNDKLISRHFGQIKEIQSGIFEYTCPCGEHLRKKRQDIVEVIKGIRSSGLCKKCSIEQYKISFKEKHGVENPALLESVKQKKKETFIKTFGVEHPSKCESIKQQKKETYQKKYGVDNPMKVEEIQLKVKQTNLETYGVDHPMKNKDVQNKTKETCLLKYEAPNPMQNKDVRQKSIKTCIQNLGVMYPMQNKLVQEKSIETNLTKYQVPNVMQNEEILRKQQKSAYKTKKYTFPSGNVIDIQGYEHFAINDLVAEGYEESDIVVDGVPEIFYHTEDQVAHRYYPDIFIKSEKKMIEIKSVFTLQLNQDINFLKWKAVVDKEFKMEIRVYDGKGMLLSLCDFIVPPK